MFSEIAEATEVNFSKDVKLKKKTKTNQQHKNEHFSPESFFWLFPYLQEHLIWQIALPNRAHKEFQYI